MRQPSLNCGLVFDQVAKRAGLGLLVVILLAITSCRPRNDVSKNGDGQLIVFAAASLTETFDAAARQFESNHHGLTVVLNLAGSQQLAHQLSQGAPADIFASADAAQMQAAVETGRVKPGSQVTFANNRLALIVPAENPAGLHSLSDLARSGLRLVLAAQEVPAGHYAMLLLESVAADPGYGAIFRDRVLANVVSFEENVRAVLSKVRLGEADAGIVYMSDVKPELVNGVRQIPIPDQLNVQAGYLIAPLANSRQPDLARDFIDFMLSEQGQELLRANGFTPVVTE